MKGAIPLTNKKDQESSGLANRYYEQEDYQRNDQLSSGLATTHEQVSDTLAEGEIHAVIDDVNGKDIPVERKGYDE